MRYSASEKYQIIQLVQHSDLSVKRTLARLDIHNSTFYNWLGRYHDGGIDALEDNKPQPSLLLGSGERVEVFVAVINSTTLYAPRR